MNLVNELQSLVGAKQIKIADAEKAYAATDQATNVTGSIPQLVIIPTTKEELIDCVRCCLKHRAPIVVRGAGTGKSGGATAFSDSVVIDVSELNRMSIDVHDMVAIVEPGVVLFDLKERAREKNLFYPPDPASFRSCTIGGNVAENAAGPSTIKYGTTRDYLLGGQAILGTGEVIDFGKRSPKGVCGFDIASLLCGSEGTLAIFTQFTLRLLPRPQGESAAFCYFHDEEEALSAVSMILAKGFLPKTVEYVDAHCLSALKKLTGSETPSRANAALIIECDAPSQLGADDAIDSLIEALNNFGLLKSIAARSVDERTRLWHTRSLLSEACTKYLGHKLSEDIAVPLGQLQSLRKAVKEFERPPHLICGLFGHAGDGNLHVQIMFDDDNLKERAQIARHELLLTILNLGGTLAAEHGIGLQKKAYLPLEQSPSLIDLQKRIKRVFDPHNLLNPRKIFDA